MSTLDELTKKVKEALQLDSDKAKTILVNACNKILKHRSFTDLLVQEETEEKRKENTTVIYTWADSIVRASSLWKTNPFSHPELTDPEFKGRFFNYLQESHKEKSRSILCAQ